MNIEWKKCAQLLCASIFFTVAPQVQAEISWRLGPELPNIYNFATPFMQMHGMAYCNGYVYAIGGNIGGGPDSGPPDNWPLGDNPHIYYAKVLSPGVLGPWQVASAWLPTYPGSDIGGTATPKPHYVYIERRTFSYENRIYVVGGYGHYPTGAAYPERSQTLIITPDVNGDVTTSSMQIQEWDTMPPRWETSVAVNPNTGVVYAVGGSASTSWASANISNEIYCAQINPATGLLSPWQFFGNQAPNSDVTTNFDGIGYMPAVVLNNKLYTLSGRIGPGTIRSCQYIDLETATTGSAVMTDCGPAGFLLPVRVDGGASVLNGNIYLYGGAISSDSNTQKTTHKAILDPVTGAITGWIDIEAEIPVVSSYNGVTTGLRRLPNAATDGHALYLAGGAISAGNRSNSTYIAYDEAGIEDYMLY